MNRKGSVLQEASGRTRTHDSHEEPERIKLTEAEERGLPGAGEDRKASVKWYNTAVSQDE